MHLRETRRALRIDKFMANRSNYIDSSRVQRASISKHAKTLCTAGTRTAMTASLVSLHVAPYAEGFSTSFVGTLEWLFTSMRMIVDPETGRSRKCFVAH